MTISGGVGRRRHRTKALDECARRLSHRYQDGRRLKRDSRQQGDREQEVSEEQDPPERSDRYDVEYDVHGVASATSSPRRRSARAAPIIERIEPRDNLEYVAGPIGPTCCNRCRSPGAFLSFRDLQPRLRG